MFVGIFFNNATMINISKLIESPANALRVIAQTIQYPARYAMKNHKGVSFSHFIFRRPATPTIKTT
jgi:hypothetical protein